ncbi:MAG: hypothetical protein AAFO07_15175 [Bacteroidota bacterium]
MNRHPSIVTELTEMEIQKIAIGCLKHYYRYYPRVGETTAKVNVRAEGDIIADGYLSFEQEDGSTFTATLEATSRMTSKEVKYRMQYSLLFWDSFTVGSYVTLGFIAWQHIFRDNLWVAQYGTVVAILFQLAILLLSMATFAGLFSRRKRYRYIYAIAQFKQYYANDQWIAVGEDVFVSKNDKHLKELMNQCVIHGMGLILIDRASVPHIRIAPARVDHFDHKRKVLEFGTLEELTKNVVVSNNMRTGISKYLPKIQLPFDTSSLQTIRFQTPYGNQIVLSLIAIILSTIIMFRQHKEEKEITYVDELTYPQLMASKRLYPYYYLGLDTVYPLDTPYIVKIPRDVNASKYVLTKGDYRQAGLIIYSSEGIMVEYACERLNDISTSKFAITAGRFSTMEELRKVIIRLNQQGITASGLWAGCFSDSDEYLLYIGDLYFNVDEARADLRVIRNRLRQAQYDASAFIFELVF